MATNESKDYQRPGTPSLGHLADDIATSSRIVEEFLKTNGHNRAPPEGNAPASTLPPDAPAEIAIARRTLIDAALKMYQLAAGPTEFLASTMAVAYQLQAAIRWLTHFKIFNLIPLIGAASYTSIASSANVPVSYLRRLVRLVMTQNIFWEPKPEYIAHTATSALLVSGPELHDWAAFMAEMSVPTANHLVEATERWGESVAKNETAYNVAFKTDLPFFTHLAQPEMARYNKLFAGYMRCVAAGEGTNIKHLLHGFDWGSLPEGARIVDVGGSTGHASIALAQAHPGLTFVVQDSPTVIEAAPRALAERSLPDSITSRITFEAQDFFQPRPAALGSPPATIYLLRMIIHDWPDAEATRILTNLLPSLEQGPNARIVIMDTVLPEPGSVSPQVEAVLRVRDLTMLQVFNSRERELADWVQLVGGVDKRLQIRKAVQPVGSAMTVMEVRLGLGAQDWKDGLHIDTSF